MKLSKNDLGSFTGEVHVTSDAKLTSRTVEELRRVAREANKLPAETPLVILNIIPLERR